MQTVVVVGMGIRFTPCWSGLPFLKVVLFTHSYSSKKEVQSAIQNTPFRPGGVFTAMAMRKALKLFKPEQRKDATKVSLSSPISMEKSRSIKHLSVFLDLQRNMDFPFSHERFKKMYMLFRLNEIKHKVFTVNLTFWLRQQRSVWSKFSYASWRASL